MSLWSEGTFFDVVLVDLDHLLSLLCGGGLLKTISRDLQDPRAPFTKTEVVRFLLVLSFAPLLSDLQARTHILEEWQCFHPSSSDGTVFTHAWSEEACLDLFSPI